MRPLPLAKAVEFYLQKRRQLGFPLKEDGQMLHQLVAYALEHGHRGPLTSQLPLAWAQLPAQASPLWWARRLDAARRFAAFWSAFDPRTQVPPPGVLGPSYRRRSVHLYSGEQITVLMQRARQLEGLRGLTFQTLIGLLACTGLRIGEALRLQEQDIDWRASLLMVRHSKLCRSRCLPIQASTLSALDGYRQQRRKHLRQTNPTPLFVGKNGRAMAYLEAARTFASLRQHLGWTQPPVPRLHDLRHTFAVGCLIDWYRQGGDVAHKILGLATYLGHSHIQGTYWYLSAVPELLALTQARWRQLSTKPGGAHAS
ncbi:Integrase family protein (fragment) [Verrucomicrobia bacterium]